MPSDKVVIEFKDGKKLTKFHMPRHSMVTGSWYIFQQPFFH